MSKNLLITRKQLYQIELFCVVAAAIVMAVVVVLKIVALIQPVVLPPSANVQQLKLQNAINLMNAPTSSN